MPMSDLLFSELLVWEFLSQMVWPEYLLAGRLHGSQLRQPLLGVV